MNDPIKFAREFAIAAHGDQMYGVHPYSTHLEAVAQNAAPFGVDAQVIAYLHDVVEDTRVTLDAIRAQFGDQIAACVAVLTDESGINRKERKARTNAKLKAVSDDLKLALVVKAADRLATLTASVRDGESSKLHMYRKEHAAFRDAAFRAGLCDNLWNEMERLLDAGNAQER